MKNTIFLKSRIRNYFLTKFFSHGRCEKIILRINKKIKKLKLNKPENHLEAIKVLQQKKKLLAKRMKMIRSLSENALTIFYNQF